MIIDSFKGVNGWLSNMATVLVIFDNVEYPSVEHAYVAGKTTDKEIRRKIALIETAYDAKRFGKSLRLRPDWDTIKDSHMLSLLRQKFSRAYYKIRLERTGDATLIEGNYWNDTYWGICKGIGLNKLGELIMQVREENRLTDMAAQWSL